MIEVRNIPSIKFILDKNNFNQMLEIISKGMTSTNEEIKERTAKIKNKLLRYSIPFEGENKEEQVNILLYQNELTDIYAIILATLNIKPNNDYYKVLLETRAKYK